MDSNFVITSNLVQSPPILLPATAILNNKEPIATQIRKYCSNTLNFYPVLKKYLPTNLDAILFYYTAAFSPDCQPINLIFDTLWLINDDKARAEMIELMQKYNRGRIGTFAFYQHLALSVDHIILKQYIQRLTDAIAEITNLTDGQYIGRFLALGIYTIGTQDTKPQQKYIAELEQKLADMIYNY